MALEYKHRIIEHKNGSFEPQSRLACFFGLFCNPFSDWGSSLIVGPKYFGTYEEAVKATQWRSDWGRGRLDYQKQVESKEVHYL